MLADLLCQCWHDIRLIPSFWPGGPIPKPATTPQDQSCIATHDVQLANTKCLGLTLSDDQLHWVLEAPDAVAFSAASATAARPPLRSPAGPNPGQRFQPALRQKDKGATLSWYYSSQYSHEHAESKEFCLHGKTMEKGHGCWPARSFVAWPKPGPVLKSACSLGGWLS